jgi:prepilin signal peptidase PulO-like enzyme (type II secretory pathway)
LFFRKELGAGDVKLFAAIGIWLGGQTGILVELCAFIAFYLFLLPFTLVRRYSSRPGSGSAPFRNGARWPFAPYILFGYVVVTAVIGT